MKFSAVLFVFTLLFTSCSKEVRLANNLEGDWNVTSFFIDGESEFEYITKFIMTYEEYDKDSSEGDFEWLITEDGDTELLSGEYSLNEDADEIELIVDGELVEFDIELDGDNLEFEGMIDGEPFKIKAERE